TIYALISSCLPFVFLLLTLPPSHPPFHYTTLFRSFSILDGERFGTNLTGINEYSNAPRLSLSIFTRLILYTFSFISICKALLTLESTISLLKLNVLCGWDSFSHSSLRRETNFDKSFSSFLFTNVPFPLCRYNTPSLTNS